MPVAKGKLLFNYKAKSGGIHAIYKYHKQKPQHWVYKGSSQQVQEAQGKISPEASEHQNMTVAYNPRVGGGAQEEIKQ